LLLILLVALAFLATHVAYEWLAKRLLIVSGAEYLVLGVLLGPQVSGLLTPNAMRAFEPILVLGIGWMGISAGMGLRLQRLVRIPAVTYRLSLVESLFTLALVAAGTSAALAYGFAMPLTTVLAPGVALGAIAVASTPAGLDVAYATRRRIPVLQQIEVAHGMNGLLSVLAFGVLIAWMHDTTPIMTRALTTTEWVVVTLGIGVVGGALFHLFLAGDQAKDRLFISLGGAVMLASGAAAYLELSPALAMLAMALILANSLRRPGAVSAVLRTGERPLYYVLLLLAGAQWSSTGTIVSWLVIAHYVVLRTLSKLWGTGIITWINRAQPFVGLDWGRAMIGQGRLTMALALDYARRDLPYGDVVFTAAAVSVLFTEFLAARFVRSAVDPLLAPLEQVASTANAVVDSVAGTMASRLPAFLRERDAHRDDGAARDEHGDAR
jgi:hypothetical protein